PNQADHLGLERLIFFSDAVFAIAITLLALQIRLPLSQGEVTNAALLKSLLAIWPDYLAYTLSFLVIGVFWIGHHRKFRYIQRYDGNLLFLNLLLLMAIAFTPFPSSVLSEYGNRTATIFYALVMTVTGLLSASIWWYAAYHNRLIDPQMDVRRRHRETWPPLIVPAVFLLSIGLAFINDDLAKYSWGLIILVTVPSLILR
ncbi:MAG: DUF1211 domain-containing protein, partial [Anaerolineae bacterium]|nr:DUF1211 domain-containing protein [Anaerolineae bacterium]